MGAEEDAEIFLCLVFTHDLGGFGAMVLNARSALLQYNILVVANSNQHLQLEAAIKKSSHKEIWVKTFCLKFSNAKKLGLVISVS